MREIKPRAILSPSARKPTNSKPTTAMTITNATKKLEKAGFKVEQYGNTRRASHPSTKYVVEFLKNGSEDCVVCINVRSIDDKHDSQSDYCAGVWANNIGQAIKLALN